MKELQAAAKLKDSERLASLAHTLKGNFANFGLSPLAEFARELELHGPGRRGPRLKKR
jgi:HPt (histidine-containing phosphotransfer) domain-containing protein